MRKLWFSFRFEFVDSSDLYFRNNGKCKIQYFFIEHDLLCIFCIVSMVQVIRVAQSNRYTYNTAHCCFRFIIFSQRRIHYFKLILIFTAFTFAFKIYNFFLFISNHHRFELAMFNSKALHKWQNSLRLTTKMLRKKSSIIKS